MVILYSQRQSLAQPHASAVKKTGKQAGNAFHDAKYLPHFPRYQHNRNALGRHRAAYVQHSRQLDIQHFLIQGQQRAQHLPMGRWCCFSLIRQHGQECLDFLAIHVFRML
jgi:hypothetical protein